MNGRDRCILYSQYTMMKVNCNRHHVFLVDGRSGYEFWIELEVMSVIT